MSDKFLSKNPDIGSIDDLPDEEMTRLKKEIKEKELDKKGKKRPWSTLKRCPACAVKGLAQYYWGAGNLSPSGVPMDIPDTNAELIEVHQIDNMLRQSTPGAAIGAANVQEDPEEMQTRLLTACLESVNHNLAAHRDWKTRYEALFILQFECIWRGACGHQQPVPFGTNVDSIGFNNISVRAEGNPDSVEEAIRRDFRPRTLNVGNCAQCMTQQQKTETIRIEGSPEYLRIKLSIINRGGSKNENPIKIPDVLNLSEYQAVVGGDPPPLKYRLSSVLAHGGTNEAGHWVASVRGPKNVFYINDDSAVQRPVSHLKANPQVYGQMEMQAVVLMYKRFETRLGLN